MQPIFGFLTLLHQTLLEAGLQRLLGMMQTVHDPVGLIQPHCLNSGTAMMYFGQPLQPVYARERAVLSNTNVESKTAANRKSLWRR